MTNTYITDAHRSSVEEVLSKALNGEMTDNFIFPLFTKVQGSADPDPTPALILSPTSHASFTHFTRFTRFAEVNEEGWSVTG